MSSKRAFPLRDSFNACPVAWQNFFNEECADGPTNRWGEVTTVYVNEKLKPYSGKYYPGGLVFKTEQHKVVWLLRYA